MKRIVNFVLLTALGLVTLTVTATAQTSAPIDNRVSPRIDYATYYPGQTAASLRLVDWDDHRRCDGDHDRDDSNCYWRDRDGDRYYYRGKGYVSHGYVAYGPMYYPGGWYDKHGRWHRDGWYDRDGRWHKGNPAR